MFSISPADAGVSLPDGSSPITRLFARFHRLCPAGAGVRSAGACLLLLFVLLAPAEAGAWDTVLEEDNLHVEWRPHAGSVVMDLRGTTRLRASLEAVVALLRDDAYNRHWVYRSGGARILRQEDYRQAYVYGIVDAPWPIADRDTVVRFDYSQAPETGMITIDITNVPQFIPDKPGLVRVPDFGGSWQLSPLDNGTVEVIYQVYGDPGGWVPPWLANRAASLSVIRTLRNMPAAVERYQDVKLYYINSVEEPVPATP